MRAFIFHTIAAFIVAASASRIATADPLSLQRLRHPGIMHALLFSSDGKRPVFAICDTGSEVVVWDLDLQKIRHTFPGEMSEERRIAISPDGRILAIARCGKDIALWNMESGKEIKKTTLPHYQFLCSIIFSPRKNELAVEGTGVIGKRIEGAITLWEISHDRALFTLSFSKGASRNIVFSPDGRNFVTGDGLCLWESATGRLRKRLLVSEDKQLPFSFSPDARQIVTISPGPTPREKSRIILFDITGDKITWEQEYMCDCVFFSPNGKFIATMYADSHLERTCLAIWNASSGKVLWKVAGKQEYPSSFFSPNSELLVTSHDSDGNVTIREVRTGKLLDRLKNADFRLSRKEFSPDGSTLVISKYNTGDIYLWNVADCIKKR